MRWQLLWPARARHDGARDGPEAGLLDARVSDLGGMWRLRLHSSDRQRQSLRDGLKRKRVVGHRARSRQSTKTYTSRPASVCQYCQSEIRELFCSSILRESVLCVGQRGVWGLLHASQGQDSEPAGHD